MNINYINTFLTVVQHGNFTAAAKALYISQPTASMHISALEKYYGCTLLLRNKNCITLTPAGKVLFEDSKKIVTIFNNIESEINYILNNISGTIHFGASQTIAEYFLPAFLKLFSEKYQAKLTMLVDNTYNILDMLRSDKIEIGLVEGTIDDTHYDTNQYLTEVFAFDKMGVVVPVDHALAELRCVHIEDLLRFPLVVREEGSGTRRIFEKAIEK
jgi:DNA-binding transcriptional LysR family regulator